jgi:hypothetical protein
VAPCVKTKTLTGQPHSQPVQIEKDATTPVRITPRQPKAQYGRGPGFKGPGGERFARKMSRRRQSCSRCASAVPRAGAFELPISEDDGPSMSLWEAGW